MPTKHPTITLREVMRKKEELAVELLEKGELTAKQVANDRRINVHPTTVQRWAKKNHIELRFPYNRHEDRLNLVDVSEIIRLRKKKGIGKRPLFTYLEIAGLCQCSESYVKKVIIQAKKEGKL